VDVVFAVRHVLVLAESKGRSSQARTDVDKLRSIRDGLGLDGIRQQLERQNIQVPPEVTTLVLAVAVETMDTDVLSDFAFILATDQGIEASFGPAVEVSAVDTLRQFIDYLRKNSR
jgi:hypothetical protein